MSKGKLINKTTFKSLKKSVLLEAKYEAIMLGLELAHITVYYTALFDSYKFSKHLVKATL